MSGLTPPPPSTLFPPEILAAAEDTLDKLLCNCSESCGGTEGVRKAAITDIANALMAERHRWFNAIDDKMAGQMLDLLKAPINNWWLEEDAFEGWK